MAKVPETYRKSFDAEAAKPDWKEIAATHLRLRRALAEKRFANLDTALSTAHQAFLQNPAQETRLYWLYEIFDTLDKADSAALRLDSRLLLPHLAFITIASTGGTAANEWDAMRAAYDASPASFLCWRRFVWFQTPRWGGSYEGMHKYSDFIEAMAELNPALLQVRGLIANDEAQVLRSDKKHLEALQDAEKAVAFNPLGSLALTQAKRHDAALQFLNQAIKLKPDFFEAYLLVDYVYARQGQWKPILKYWDAYIARFPENDTAYFERSGTHYHAGNLAAPKAEAERACQGGHEEACKLYRRKFGGAL